MSLVLIVLAAASAFMGCALLALSQPRHWQAVTGALSLPPRRLRRAGWGLILASLAACAFRDGASLAALLWPLLLMAGALGVAWLLAWRPAAFRGLARLAADQPRGSALMQPGSGD